ncbi:hypothetical protein BZG74_05125 [Salinivibrio sharmensis]|uniref:N-acetyltransferase domain-containing protein n=2 Tax=Salinivibrio sharmensis TaxID=390883 RepID=A0ABX3KIY9_9GAMM|nr:hypothetical protein BZG74_05125 [Salinivibrio sharmensis]
MVMYSTERLTLRAWHASDLIPFAALNQDPDVMRYFPSVLSRAQSDAMASHIQSKLADNGFGFWAVELTETREFIGFVGLNRPTFELGHQPFVEIGWRLASPHWGKGYATEAAQKALAIGFEDVELPAIYAFTTESNLPSQAVMKKLGMTPAAPFTFLHPHLAADHPLATHVLYAISKATWQADHAD